MSDPLCTIAHMDTSKIWVEAWSPEYGSSFEVANGIAQTEEEVAPYVETREWQALSPRPCAFPVAAFIDGVSRVDARAYLQTEETTVQGIFGSVGIGAVLVEGSATFGPTQVHRAAIFGGGRSADAPPMPAPLAYASRSVPGERPEEIRKGLESFRHEVEVKMAHRLAQQGYLVIADGALGVFEPVDIVGFIKSHAKAYLPPPIDRVVADLGAGQRTPVFQFDVIRPRYSWYLRLADGEGQHPWAGVARCEVSATMSLERAIGLADMVTSNLPRFASRPFWDTRAPQNLVPIATLERRLWHLLGDRNLVYRHIRSSFESSRRPQLV